MELKNYEQLKKLNEILKFDFEFLLDSEEHMKCSHNYEWYSKNKFRVKARASGAATFHFREF